MLFLLQTIVGFKTYPNLETTLSQKVKLDRKMFWLPKNLTQLGALSPQRKFSEWAHYDLF